jgi:2-polyprenyl-6-methoxyphenol hydroxylase-like FAD-dependent oxidoreductase
MKRNIKSVAVIGSGVMGSGIACHFANVGIKVLLLDITPNKLNEKEETEIKEWQDAIKKVYGEYGLFDFTFTPNGIGTGIRVYSHVAKVEKDFTDIDSW